jgi:hypothetical protein
MTLALAIVVIGAIITAAVVLDFGTPLSGSIMI